MNKLFGNRKGYGIMVTWAMVIFTGFIIGLLYVVFNMVLVDHIMPKYNELILLVVKSPALQASLTAQTAEYFTYWAIFPLFFIFALIAYGIWKTFTLREQY